MHGVIAIRMVMIGDGYVLIINGMDHVYQNQLYQMEILYSEKLVHLKYLMMLELMRLQYVMQERLQL